MKVIDVVDELPVHPTKKNKIRPLSDIKMIVVHTTDWDTTPHKLAKYDVTPYFIVDGKKVYNHISRTGCCSITYHEGVMRDGTVHPTLRWTEEAWHAGKWNPQSVGIALYSEADRVYPEKMIDSLIKRCAWMCMQLKLSPDKVVGHRELKGTGWFWHKGSRKLRKSCPGMQLDLDYLRTAICMVMQYQLGVTVDGDFGPQSRKALRDK